MLKYILLSVVCFAAIASIQSRPRFLRPVPPHILSFFEELWSNVALDPLLINDEFKFNVPLAAGGFHFHYEIHLESINITGLEKNAHETPQVVEDFDDKGASKSFITVYRLEKPKINIQSYVSINKYNSSLVSVDIADDFVFVEIEITDFGVIVNVDSVQQVRMQQLPTESPLSLIEDQIAQAFIEMFNTKAKPVMVKLIEKLIKFQLALVRKNAGVKW